MGSANIHSSRNQVFHEDGTHGKEYPYPFRRYIPLVRELKKNGLDFKVINVVNDQSIDLSSFRFEDHQKNLELASKMAVLEIYSPIHNINDMLYEL